MGRSKLANVDVIGASKGEGKKETIYGSEEDKIITCYSY